MESLNVRVTREEVEHFLSIKSRADYGYGDGFGSGYGSTDSYGNCYGYGDGFGIGSGCSYGYDCGMDWPQVLGARYDCGYGKELGYGNGNRDIKTFNGYIVDYIDKVPTIITNIYNSTAKGFVIKYDMTLEPCYVAKAGNYFAHGKTLKDTVKDAEVKEMGEMPIEERINKFIEVFGSLDSEHTGKEFYDWHHILTGSCRMGRDVFCKENEIDLEKKYSVRFFLDITKNSFGGDIIKRIINELTKG